MSEAAMNMENFYQLIKGASLTEKTKNILSQATITKVEISTRQRQWRVHLVLSAMISREEIRRLEEEISRILGGLAGVRLLIQYLLPDAHPDDIIRRYWPEIVFLLSEKYPSLEGWLNKADYVFRDKELTITVHNQMGQQLLINKGCDRFINNLLKHEIGLEVKTVFKSEENDQQDLCWQEEAEKQHVLALMEARVSSSTHNDQPKAEQPTVTAKNGVILGKPIKGEALVIREVQDEEKNVVIQGQIFSLEVRELRSGRRLIIFDLTDLTDSITVKFFRDEKNDPIEDLLKKGSWVKVRGPVQYDRFSKDQELALMAYDINIAEYETRKDKAPEKRVELHVHTKMSSMDGLSSASDLIKRAAQWGHSAIAITDHGVVQAFPEAHETGRKHGIKVIYGVEGYLVDDGTPIVLNPVEMELSKGEYIVFDIETTGFSPSANEIIEIGAVKVVDGIITQRFSSFIKPDNPIPYEITQLTGINHNMVSDAPPIVEVLPRFMEFVGNGVLVAHNALFDTGFLRVKLNRHLGRSLANPILDTLGLARALLPKLKNHKLKTLTEEFDVKLENHHRAVDDADATTQIFLKLLALCKEQEANSLEQVNTLVKNINLDQLKSNHIIILVQNQTGLLNLYQLITKAHLEYFHRYPRIPKSQLVKHREGLILGSACEAGQLIRAYLDGASSEKLEEIAGFYDYLEIQPIGNNSFMLKEGIARCWEDLQKINHTIVELGEFLNIPVVATGDVHFLDPEDEVYRRILMAGKGFEDADDQAPLYFRTTEEMLGEFTYLGPAKAREVVISNPRLIADRIEELKPMPDDFYPPEIDGAEDQIRDMTYATAWHIYGNPLPDIVQKRVDKELNSIINNGFSVLYLVAQKLVKKSNDDGYLVGSRGSVGSSFVATMTGITEVNPLPPHYVCPNCKHNEFIMDGSYGSGADLPDKDCPSCGSRYKKDGHDIPFEVFLGFEGDKVPDIDLNFSGEYQPRAHKYTEELFGEGYVFRAGTTGTIAEKTAFGFVKNYLDERKTVKRNAEMSRLVQGCTGVKRTTGQHPGGVMVVPRNMDVHEFTPLQHPADDKKSGIITTHFDYHSISGRIVKLDILGHDDPTAIKMLEDLTGIDAKTIPLDEPEVLKLFSGTESLGLSPEQIRSQTGTYGIPEFGTKFVRQMLEDTKPNTFSELVCISGFSHGTDVWLNNAQDLIRSGTCRLSEAISTRDDIMVYLIYQGLEPSCAFKIMEGVRKGKGVKADDEENMLEHDTPQWYIESCKKIKYMFPKAHAVAYVMMAFRIAYFKVYYPEAFYATYFSVRADEFDADLICQGPEAITMMMEEIEAKGNQASQKEKNLLTILELALEMYMRGIKLARVDMNQSDATRFKIHEVGLLLPSLVALQGLGENAAKNIVAARQEGPFSSIEDLRLRARISKTVIEILVKHGCLKGLSATDQLELF
ncbi:MAG: PolC-type DNA polymerase III [Thermincolia bacterium]